MSVQFRCKLCGKRLSAKPKLAGRKLKCPYCRTEVTVPADDDASLIEPGAAANTASHQHDEPPTDSPLLLFQRKEKHEDLIDMTAMVDIVFFLLIFFMVTSMAPLEAVLNLPAPQAEDSAANDVQTVPNYADDPNIVVVTIDADNAVWVEDQEALSEQDLRSKLRAAVSDGQRDSMLVQGAADATHGKFVMVLDAGAAVGMKEIMFSVEETEVEGDSG
jgi:biopolymer transport protein ExbD